MNESREAERHRLIGGALCIDFANTANGHQDPPMHEYLHDYRDLVLWAQHATALSSQDARALLRAASARPAAAEAALRKALSLRATLFRIFFSLARRKNPAAPDLAVLIAAWREALQHRSIGRTSGGFELSWDDQPAFERIARDVLVSAVQVLTSERTGRLHACAGSNCDWLFIDDSRNHLRRWCSMDECGNRAKMQRRRARRQVAILR